MDTQSESISILYVHRDMDTHGVLKKAYRFLRKAVFFDGPEGFFEASLDKVGDVTTVGIGTVLRGSIDLDNFDVVIFNNKAKKFLTDEEEVSFFKTCREKTLGTFVLFIMNDKAGYMPSDEVLDIFDVIFKREPFLNRDRYDISETNKTKIVPTMLCSHIPKLPTANLLGNLYSVLPNPKKNMLKERVTPKHDVFFIAKMCKDHTLRQDVGYA